MKCPLCSKPASATHNPFCSKRCADVDLSRWFTGAYTVPLAPDDDADDATPQHPENIND